MFAVELRRSNAAWRLAPAPGVVTEVCIRVQPGVVLGLLLVVLLEVQGTTRLDAKYCEPTHIPLTLGRFRYISRHALTVWWCTCALNAAMFGRTHLRCTCWHPLAPTERPLTPTDAHWAPSTCAGMDLTSMDVWTQGEGWPCGCVLD